MNDKKKTKRINKIRNTFGILAIIFLIASISFGITSCENSYYSSFKVNIDEETKKISVLSDKDIQDINFKFNIDTVNYGYRNETVHFDEIKAHKLTPIELEIIANNKIEITDIKYISSSTPLESIFGNTGWILFGLSFIFAIISGIIIMLQTDGIIDS